MPRKKEASFEMKKLIWDKAVTTGNKPEVIQRELDDELRSFHKGDYLFETVPDSRTIKRIIEKDINQLEPEVVIDKLPRHTWHLRDDYEILKELAVNTIGEASLPEKQKIALLVIASNLEKIRNAPAESLGDPFGHTIFTVGEKALGGRWIHEDLAKLGDVDRVASVELLKRLKDESAFPELADIEIWEDLKESLVTEEFIQRLISRAHRGNY